ncbi:hypothetical protein BC833DRAFT_569527 [Globomyces pollinis-pini]|nr:hypothetical protein BC833DRAFT_569527 [Globomyces pollinis-pini]
MEWILVYLVNYQIYYYFNLEQKFGLIRWNPLICRFPWFWSYTILSYAALFAKTSFPYFGALGSFRQYLKHPEWQTELEVLNDTDDKQKYWQNFLCGSMPSSDIKII